MGKNVKEAVQLKNTDISKHLNLPPVKLHCSMLAEVSEFLNNLGNLYPFPKLKLLFDFCFGKDAIKAAIQDWSKKNGGKLKTDAS